MQDFSHHQYYQSVTSEDAYHSELPPQHLPTGPKELSSITAYDRFLRGHLSSFSRCVGGRDSLPRGWSLGVLGLRFTPLFFQLSFVSTSSKKKHSWKDQLEAMKLANYIWLRKKTWQTCVIPWRWHPAAGWKQVQCSKVWFVELLNLDGFNRA